ncbi:PREDICTED: uncharacterized protein LOC108977395 [Bactrocera latifrons]|uniref:uncharacterized protein LOC108977395 n=1 Tax=Bactrocera latifrons TaxID=174628 RepID=UPI0008DD29F5|nr:PREDICTED: uncharacterized protein LOC108977395 [Bactrocera latifrons]
MSEGIGAEIVGPRTRLPVPMETGKCHRPSGTLHRNPYLNFLREFLLRNTGLAAVEIIRRGDGEWRSMFKHDKLQFIKEAFYAPTKRKAPPPPPPANADARDAIPG